MPIALICFNEGENFRVLKNSLSGLAGWDILPHNINSDDVNNIHITHHHIELHYLIYTNQISPKAISDLQVIRQNNPLTHIIYYNSFLVNQQFFKLSELGVNSCIIGSDRRKNLKETLTNLWLDHWKRIPEKIYSYSNGKNNFRKGKVIRYLENSPISECTPQKISEYLNISKSHFRAEFKSYFGMNFRDFKQQLFRHYEFRLRTVNKYKLSEIFKILNYKYKANYSRSFKMRHGESWRNLRESG
jgi:AraC-like DNA-binding protein